MGRKVREALQRKRCTEWHAIVGKLVIQVDCGEVRSGVASRSSDERIVARETLKREGGEGVGPHARPPVALRSRSDGAIHGANVPDNHLLHSSCPNAHAVITAVLDVAVLKEKALHRTVHVQTVRPGVRSQRGRIKFVSK